MSEEGFKAGVTIRAGETVIVTGDGEVVPVGRRPGLVEFLLARIAEDEAYAPNEEQDDPSVVQRVSEERMLAECRAKRRIVERCVERMEDGADSDGQLMTSGANLAREILRDLGSAYAEHPDYRDDCRW